MTELVRYDSMLSAIADCVAVDEVKEISNKAQALAAYQRQAGNFEAERQCLEIRVRAERQCGRLLSEIPAAKGGKPYQSKGVTGKKGKPKTLKELGFTRGQAASYKKLAEIPAAKFENLVAKMPRPSAAQLLRITGPTKSAGHRYNLPELTGADFERAASAEAKKLIWLLSNQMPLANVDDVARELVKPGWGPTDKVEKVFPFMRELEARIKHLRALPEGAAGLAPIKETENLSVVKGEKPH